MSSRNHNVGTDDVAGAKEKRPPQLDEEKEEEVAAVAAGEPPAKKIKILQPRLLRQQETETVAEIKATKKQHNLATASSSSISATEDLLTKKDIWVNHIFSFLGPGHYIFVGGVSKTFQEFYRLYFSTIKIKDTASLTNTYYSAAFASVACAKFWDLDTKGQNDRLLDSMVCPIVARYGNLEVLKWARKQGFKWDIRTCAAAARGGHLELLKYARKNGCPWNTLTCGAAAIGGHLELLKYAHKHGCEWDTTIYSYICQCASKSGKVEVLQYAHENGCPWDSIGGSCYDAANLACLQYARENGCPWGGAYTCSNFAGRGQLEMLQYAHVNGCPWDERTCSEAARCGRLDILQWARDNGCPWNSWTLWGAIRYAHQEIVEYARANGCPEPPPHWF